MENEAPIIDRLQPLGPTVYLFITKRIEKGSLAKFALKSPKRQNITRVQDLNIYEDASAKEKPEPVMNSRFCTYDHRDRGYGWHVLQMLTIVT